MFQARRFIAITLRLYYPQVYLKLLAKTPLSSLHFEVTVLYTYYTQETVLFKLVVKWTNLSVYLVLKTHCYIHCIQIHLDIHRTHSLVPIILFVRPPYFT